MEPTTPTNSSPDPQADAAAKALAALAKAGGAGARPRRRWRWWLRGVVLVLVLIPVMLAVLTQGPLPAAVLRAYVRANLGLEFDADWVSLKLDGRRVVSGMTLRAPGLDGAPGRFVAARRVEVDLDLSRLAALEVSPTHARVQGPIFRFSQSQTDGALNVASIRLPPGSGGSARLPRIDVEDGTVEFGEHNGGDFRALMSLGVRGFVAPRDAAGAAYRLRLVQTGGDSVAAVGGVGGVGGGTGASPAPEAPLQEGAVVLDGTLDARSGAGDLSLSGIELAKWTAERIPTQYREVWKGLEMRGQIARTRFQFSGSKIAVTLDLKDVAMRPPIVAGQAEVMGDYRPRMDDVAGTLRFTPAGIEADLRGTFEAQPCQVFLRTEGLGLDAAYSATLTSRNATLDFSPRILRFLPGVVKDNLERLGWPQGTMSAGITIRRAARAEGQPPAEATIAGTLTFDVDRIAYAVFPYEFGQVHAILTFDERQVRLVSATGVARSGAKMFAEGRFAPPDDTAACDLSVTVVDVPIDDTVRGAIDRSRAAGIHYALFSQSKYEELLAQGLVISPAQRRRLTTRLAQIKAGISEDRLDPADAGLSIEEMNRRLARPTFEVGGEIRTVAVKVARAQGPDRPTHTTVDVDFRRAGLLPQVFPYPIVAENLRLRIEDDRATLRGDQFTGLNGGSARVDGLAQFHAPTTDDTSIRFSTEIKVEAENLPIDDLVIFAVPEGRLDLGARLEMGPPRPRAKDAFSAKEVLRTLGLEGPVNCAASLSTDAQGATRFSIGVDLKGMTALPRHVHAGLPLMATNIHGRLSVSDEAVRVESLEGLIMPSDMGLAGLAALADAGQFSIRGAYDFGGPGRAGGFEANLAARDYDLTLALEDVLHAVAPGAAASLEEVRSVYSPSGRIDGEVILTAPAGAEMSLDVRLSRARDLGLDALGGRLHAALDAGEARLRVSKLSGGSMAGAELAFEDCRGAVTMGDEAPCAFELDGRVRLGDAGGNQPTRLAVLRQVRARVNQARIHSGLARSIIGLLGAESLAGDLEAARLRGQFDASVELVPRIGGAGPEDWKVRVAVEPAWAEVVMKGVPLRVSQMRGRVTLDDSAGTVERLAFKADDWAAMIDGTWGIGPEPAAGSARTWSLDSRFTLDADGLPPDLLALLPDSVRTSLEGAKVTVAGAVWTSDAALRLAGDDAGRVRVGVDAALDFVGLSVDAGLAIGECNGVVGVRADKDFESPTKLELSLFGESMRVEGVRVTAASALLASGAEPGVIELRSMSGACHGGRISGRASVVERDGAPALYTAVVDVAGVRFADILADLRRRAGQNADAGGVSAAVNPPGGAPPIIDADDPPGDASRGFVDATIALSGAMGQSELRLGRGSVRIAGGVVLNIPGIVPLVELSNLQLPLGERLDFAQAVFWVRGNRVVFDELQVLSRSLAIVGDGEVLLPEFGLDLRFNSAGRARLPLLSDVYEALRNELITTVVSGTLRDPRFSVEQLSGTRRLIGRMLGLVPDRSSPATRPEGPRPEPVRQAVVPSNP
ncbi:MAG: hypothetical protein JNJ48_01135 [Phycisphaerae bacterium]|nr:hypothetical protein [Phycisphaerae bacterium]